MNEYLNPIYDEIVRNSCCYTLKYDGKMMSQTCSTPEIVGTGKANLGEASWTAECSQAFRTTAMFSLMMLVGYI